MCEIYDNDDCASVYREKQRRAIKPHICESCHVVILPGETYCYASGVYDHRGFSEIACSACAKTREEFGDAHDFYPSFPRLSDTLHECIAEGDPESLAWKPHYEAIMERYENAQINRVVTTAFVALVERSR